MDLILVRHGPAEDRDAFAQSGRPDRERPLTDAGRQRTARAAAGLASLLDEPPRVYTSPFVRARETAEIVAHACASPGVKPLPGLAPGGRRDRLLHQCGTTGIAILVGHEPDLGILLGLLVTGQPASVHGFKKAGAAAVSFPDAPEAGAGRLTWVMPPAVLRRLAT